MLVSARHCPINGRGKMRNKLFRLARGSLFLLVFFSTHGYAQQLATARVTVTDSSGGFVAGASVTLSNADTGVKRTASTRENGLAVISDVPLAVAGHEEKVEVREAVQSVEVEKAELSQVIETKKIADLPIQGREFIDFALLTPSVSVGRSTAVGAQSPFTETVLKLSFTGVRESHTTLITQDGIDYTTSISGVQRVTPSLDWVQEFRVVTS